MPKADRVSEPETGCENQEWFQRLPEHARDDMRAVWEKRKGQSAEQQERRRRTTKRYLIEGPCLFVAVVGLFFTMNVSALLFAAVVGGGVGAVAARRRACTYQYGAFSAIGYVAYSGLFIGGLSIFPFLFVTAFGALLGLGHQLNRYDFTEL